MVLVTNLHVRGLLAEAMMGGNARRVADAPVTAVFAADLQPLSNLGAIVDLEARAGKPTRYLRGLAGDMSMALAGPGGWCGLGPSGRAAHGLKAASLAAASAVLPGLPTISSPEAWAFKGASLAAMTWMYAATAAGLASHPMEGFDAAAVRRACRIPDRYAIPMVVATGYPAADAAERRGATPSPRLPLGSMFKRDSFTTPIDADAASADGAASDGAPGAGLR